MATKYYTPYEISQMSDIKMIRSEYSRLRSVANRRISRMEAAGLGTGKRGRFESLRGMSDGEATAALAEVSRWVRDPRHTVSGERSFINTQLENLRDMGYDYINESNFYDFIEYMDDLREVYGSKLFDSGDAADVFNEAQRLKINTQEVKQHFDYYAENLEAMRRMRPVRSETGATFGAMKQKISRLK